MSASVAMPGLLWHVRLLLIGAPAPVPQLAAALRRLCDRDPGNMAVRFGSGQAELQFWDEGHDVASVAMSAARLWRSSMTETGLPDWALVGIEVLDRQRWQERLHVLPAPIAPGAVVVLEEEALPPASGG